MPMAQGVEDRYINNHRLFQQRSFTIRTHIHTHPLYESINEFSLGQMGEIMNFWHHQIIKNWVHFLKNVVKCALLNLI